jgi:DNA-directed RNA polymerase II subunit RPB2
MDNLINSFFEKNPDFLAEHHLYSFNEFTKDLSKMAPVTFKRKVGGKERKIEISVKEVRLTRPAMFPNEARLANATYAFTVSADLEVVGERTITVPNVKLATIPAMVRSTMCLLSGMPPSARFEMGECRNDPGGYFIIEGKEKVVVCEEEAAPVVIVRSQVGKYAATAEFGELLLGLVAETERAVNGNIVAVVDGKAVPLFLLMRALGVVTDKRIVETCFLDAGSVFADALVPSVHDAGKVFTQADALAYLQVVGVSVAKVLPNVKDKAFFIGHMVQKLVRVYKGVEAATDVDSLKNKRVVTSGLRLSRLFEAYYRQVQEHVEAQILKEFLYQCKEVNEGEAFASLVSGSKVLAYFRDAAVFELEPADLDRTSFLSMVKSLRGWDTVLHPTHYGMLDPVEGMALMARVTWKCPLSLPELVPLRDPTKLKELIKIFVDGVWVGSTGDPHGVVSTLLGHRREKRVSADLSVSWMMGENAIYVCTDAGRLQRPVLYLTETGLLSADLATWTWGDAKMVDYLDASESDSAYIAPKLEDLHERHTHVEIHGSLMLGVQGNLLVFPEHTPSKFDSSRAVSLYHTNHQNRMDTCAVLNYGQTPLIKSVHLKTITRNEHPYGVNVVVAVLSGYGTVVNQGALDRGMFHVTGYTAYESDAEVVVEPNSPVEEGTALMKGVPAVRPGVVDRTYMKNGVSKVKVREERAVEGGEVFASRTGQRGACAIVPEADMPFTAQGLRPDLIISPHADLTVAHLLEMLTGNFHSYNGTFGDCTAFSSPGDKCAMYASALQWCGYTSTGDAFMYDGLTGRQLEGGVFVGPAYYLRMKRDRAAASGVSNLTRQPVGGVVLDEMDCGGAAGNGLARFLSSMGGTYKMAVDSVTGLTAVGTLSPTLDGPITFDGGMQVTTSSRYNKEVTTVAVPYACKLLAQELLTMNVAMRLVTHQPKIEMEVIPMFISMPFTKRNVLGNRLYASDGPICKTPLFDTPTMGHTIFPFVTTRAGLDRLLETANFTPVPHTGVFNKAHFKSPVYADITAKSIATTADYFFNKMKRGTFVRVKDNQLADFIPLCNTEFTNDFHPLLKFSPSKEAILELAQVHRDPKKWHASNGMIRPERPDEYLAQMYDMLAETCSHRKVNDCVFFLNLSDSPHLAAKWSEAFDAIHGDKELESPYKNKPFIPVLSQCTKEGYADIPIPTGADWGLISEKYFAAWDGVNVECKNSPALQPPPWDQRLPIFYWRGSGTGGVRTTLAEKSKVIKALDVEVVPSKGQLRVFRENGVHVRPVPDTGAEPVALKDQLKFKFTFNLEGNSASYRYGALFKYGFCVLSVKSAHKLWFEQFLAGGAVVGDKVGDVASYAFIEVKSDLSDLDETVAWCLAHDEECRTIADNGAKFYARYFTHKMVYDYMAETINTVSAMVKPLPEKREKQGYEVVKFTNNTLMPLSTTVVMVPKGKNISKLLKEYSELNVLVIEQARRFDREALFNVGFDFITSTCPEIDTFVCHDPDVVCPKEVVEKYFGPDGRDVVQLGRGVVRLSRGAFKQVNGFGESLVTRIDGKFTIYRPSVVHGKPAEESVDRFNWKMKGANSIMYDVVDHAKLGRTHRKITVQLNLDIAPETSAFDIQPDAKKEDSKEEGSKESEAKEEGSKEGEPKKGEAEDGEATEGAKEDKAKEGSAIVGEAKEGEAKEDAKEDAKEGEEGAKEDTSKADTKEGEAKEEKPKEDAKEAKEDAKEAKEDKPKEAKEDAKEAKEGKPKEAKEDKPKEAKEDKSKEEAKEDKQEPKDAKEAPDSEEPEIKLGPNEKLMVDSDGTQIIARDVTAPRPVAPNSVLDNKSEVSVGSTSDPEKKVINLKI